MDTAVIIVQSVLALVFMALNFTYWWFVVRRWEGRFRRFCERRYRVVITLGGKGHWRVSGDGPWYRRFAIELLQLGYFMGAMAAWAAGVVIVIVLLAMITRS